MPQVDVEADLTQESGQGSHPNNQCVDIVPERHTLIPRQPVDHIQGFSRGLASLSFGSGTAPNSLLTCSGSSTSV